MWRYANYLRSEYQEQILQSLDSLHIPSVLEYDPNNSFAYIPIDRKIAFNCKTILRREQFIIRDNIYYNRQAGKSIIMEIS